MPKVTELVCSELEFKPRCAQPPSQTLCFLSCTLLSGCEWQRWGAVTRNDASHPNLGRLTEPHPGTSCPSLFRLSHPRRGPGIPAVPLDFRPRRALSTPGRGSCGSGQRGWVSSVRQVLAESQETCSLILALLELPEGQCPGQLSQVLVPPLPRTSGVTQGGLRNLSESILSSN